MRSVHARTILMLCLVAMTSTSCSRMRASLRNQSCHEPAIPVQTANDAPLRVVPGLELPDTRNAVRVPDLNEPEKPRAKDAPCLSRPPSYGTAAPGTTGPG